MSSLIEKCNFTQQNTPSERIILHCSLRDIIFGKSMSIDDGVFNSYMAKGSATTLDIKFALL